MLSMALARSWARKLETYSWSFFSSRANTLAVCRSMASIRFFYGPGRARPLRAEEERVAGWGCAALRVRQRERRKKDVSSTARHVGRRVDARAVKEVQCW